MTISNSNLARRYAKALFELSCKKDVLEKVENDLEALEELVISSDELNKIIGRPILSRENQSEALDKVLEKAKAQNITKNFISVLAKNRRLSELNAIIVEYKKLLSSHRGEVIAQIISAMPLSKGQTDAISKTLSEQLDKKVSIQAEVNKGILGGLVIKVGSKMLDASLISKIENIRMLTKKAIASI